LLNGVQNAILIVVEGGLSFFETGVKNFFQFKKKAYLCTPEKGKLCLIVNDKL